MIYVFKIFFIIIVFLFKAELLPSLKKNKTSRVENIVSKKKLPQRRQLYRKKKRNLKRKKKKRKIPMIAREEIPEETIIDSFGKLLIGINRHFDDDIKKIGKQIALNIKNSKNIDSEIEKLTTQVIEKKYRDIEKLIQKNIFAIQTYSEKIKLLENTNQKKLPEIPPQKKIISLNKLENINVYRPKAEKNMPSLAQVIKNTPQLQS